MKNTAIALAGYGAFLILVGLVGYLSNPEKAKTALVSGGTFGLLNIGLGVLASRGWRKAVPAALGLSLFLAAVFTWRSIVTWIAYAGGKPEKLVAGVLITSMLAASVGIALYLARKRLRA
jgi:uncharacterized membrane protein (UPF0136 family)